MLNKGVEVLVIDCCKDLIILYYVMFVKLISFGCLYDFYLFNFLLISVGVV